VLTDNGTLSFDVSFWKNRAARQTEKKKWLVLYTEILISVSTLPNFAFMFDVPSDRIVVVMKTPSGLQLKVVIGLI
jgi:hypothetical protein